jgi:hypothetical protein
LTNLRGKKNQKFEPVNYGTEFWISFTLPAAFLEHKVIDRQDVTGAETLAAPQLGLVPDAAALVIRRKL